jgi:hypothetical protein
VNPVLPRRPRPRARNARNRTRGLRASVLVSSAIAAALLASSAAVVAAPVPGTPDSVEPGVPGYGRAWELVTAPGVTPARIYGGIGSNPLLAVSTTGDRISYETVNASPESSYGALFVVNLAERGTAGWVNKTLELPYPTLTKYGRVLFRYEGELAFDPELRTSIWGNSLPAPASGLGLFFRAEDGAYSALGRIGELSEPEEAEFVGSSKDLRRIFFRSTDHLLPADASRTEGSSIYELSNSELHLVDVEDDGSLVSTCGSTNLGAGAGAYSSDGLSLFFRSKPDCGKFQRVYRRAGGHTTEISASQCTLPDPECGAEADVRFAGATPSGSVAYISTAQRLTNDDANEYEDLYRYDTSSGELTLLTPRPAASTASPGEFLLRSSSDGSRAYFAAQGQLIPGKGTVEGANLYLADSQGLHFVAMLSGSQRFAISRDGRYAAFVTSAQLAPGDRDESVDVYRYDASADRYTEVSTGPDGSGNGPFEAILPETLPYASLNPDPGQRVFFTTAEPLVPQDHNELEDVYEWTEAGGLALVSAGTPGFAGEYLGGTEDGGTVLFRTGATLLARDRDGGELDIYAARVGGGFPEPAAPAGCGTGSACDASSAGTPHRTLPGAGAGKPFIGIAPIDAAARRQLVAKGMTTLLLEAPAAGRLTAQGRARVGAQAETVATGATVAKAAGPVRLRLRLTKAARRSLAQGHDLRVRLAVRLAARKATGRDSFTLRTTR